MSDDTDVMVGLLARSLGTATEIFEAISGCSISVEVLTRVTRELTVQEHGLLDAGLDAIGHERRGFLRADNGMPVAETTAIVLPGRLAGDTCARLGIPRPGAPLPRRTSVPLGKALQDLGVRREPLEARRITGQFDAGGEEQAVFSRARLRLGSVPVGIATERVYRRFCDAGFPHPWPGELDRHGPGLSRTAARTRQPTRPH